MHMRLPLLPFPVLAALAALLLLAGPARAEDGGVSVELNKLEPAGGACRAYLVLRNASGQAFETLKLDLVMFDGDGVVARRLAVETAPLPAGKTSLRVFDIADLGCDAVGRILLNDVLACGGAQGAYEACLTRLETSARGAVPLIK
jgi:hypothetical protein